MTKFESTLTTLAIITLNITFTPQAYAEDSAGERICQYVKLNHKSRLKSYLRSQEIKIRQVYDSLKCNNKNLLVFAAEQNALSAGSYLLGRVSSKQVAATVEDIAKFSPELAQAAKARLQ
ncbi:MAG: DUF3718 domain-containing protein [Thalassotalea sp.]